MPQFSISEIGIERVEDIQPLWEELNQHHATISPHFSHLFESTSFAQRRKALHHKAEQGVVRIFLGYVNERRVGYCAVSICESHGEIESIFILEAYRGLRLGEGLMQAALAWMESNGAHSKSVNVIYGNEKAHSFYAKYGFKPRSITFLQQVPSP
ncbi:GNAT family N-acetyltransferase [Pseudodesulfovibrio piezophilus]|uniref:GCN5-related N-acetyltransferase n=1 Tax=Pseudodesulfovibrio piezophilus (strain DSM 21447 / JCM 15486 / C1TLV30) TaxID=1322246 RepID=M1WPY0_PSEP2|nr:GNAT family N-acetyltransferase [Pseudodesulfovibrio piezophilus]CCH48659.1 GCN5-related N-acetyltransferase [Pseudodesulfovibrio piezophilus C1TLV30]